MVCPGLRTAIFFVTLKSLFNFSLFVEKNSKHELPLPEDFLAALKLLRVKN
jgi:hypothetical protein